MAQKVLFEIEVDANFQELVKLQKEMDKVTKEQKELAYAKFFRMHMIVRALHLVNVGLAFSLFILKLRKALIPRLADIL